jgi:hypothetical protein
LIAGQLFRAPERRTSKAGKPFVTATIFVKDGEAAQWWKQAELMRLADSDALSVQGQLKAETYEKDGVTRLSPARMPMPAMQGGGKCRSMTRCRFRRDLRP